MGACRAFAAALQARCASRAASTAKASKSVGSPAAQVAPPGSLNTSAPITFHLDAKRRASDLQPLASYIRTLRAPEVEALAPGELLEEGGGARRALRAKAPRNPCAHVHPIRP